HRLPDLLADLRVERATASLPYHRDKAGSAVVVQRGGSWLALCLHRPDDADPEARHGVAAGSDHVRGLAAGDFILSLRADFRHDQPADGVGLSAHARGFLARLDTRPV